MRNPSYTGAKSTGHLQRMTIYTATIAVFVLLFIAIGSWAGSKVKNIDDYFVAGRRSPTLLIVGTLVASVFSTSSTELDVQVPDRR